MPFGQMCQVDDICDERYKYKLKDQYGIMYTLWTSFIPILFLFLKEDSWRILRLVSWKINYDCRARVVILSRILTIKLFPYIDHKTTPEHMSHNSTFQRYCANKAGSKSTNIKNITQLGLSNWFVGLVSLASQDALEVIKSHTYLLTYLLPDR